MKGYQLPYILAMLCYWGYNSLPQLQGQIDITYFLTDGRDFTRGVEGNFITMGFSSQEAYRLTYDTLGRMTGDSVLLFRRNWLKDSLKMEGICLDHTDRLSFNKPDKFHRFAVYFDSANRVIREYEEPVCKTHMSTDDYGRDVWERHECRYRYDSLGHMISKWYLSYSFENRWDYATSDTTVEITLHYRGFDMEYDQMGNLIRRCEKTDSTCLLPSQGQIRRCWCSNRERRYPKVEWHYDVLNRLEYRDYILGDSALHERTRYYYDQKGRLSLEVDSSGWSYYGYGNRDGTKMYHYRWGRKEKIEYGGEDFSHEERRTIYRLNGQPIRDCSALDCCGYREQGKTGLKLRLQGPERAYRQFTLLLSEHKGQISEEREYRKGKLYQRIIYRYY